MTAADREEVGREALRAAVARAVDDSGGDLLDHLGTAYLGEGADAQVIAFALEALGRRLTERAVAAQVASGPGAGGDHYCCAHIASGCQCPRCAPDREDHKRARAARRAAT